MRFRIVLAAAVMVLSSACGGGGGPAGTSPFPQHEDGPSTAQTSPFTAAGQAGSGSGGSVNSGGGTVTSSNPSQGLYFGTTDNNYEFGAVILETGELWGVYLRNGLIYGAVHGTSTSNSVGTFAGSGSDFNLQTATRLSSSFSGTYTPKSSIAGTIASTGVKFVGTYDASYDTPASASTVVGTWTGQTVSLAGTQSGTITVDSQGDFTGHVSTCNYTGRLTPRASGKAVFNMTVTFASTGCLFNGLTLNGITVVSTDGQQLITLALLDDGSSGFMAAAQK